MATRSGDSILGMKGRYYKGIECGDYVDWHRRLANTGS
jgi:hypothetical protein